MTTVISCRNDLEDGEVVASHTRSKMIIVKHNWLTLKHTNWFTDIFPALFHVKKPRIKMDTDLPRVMMNHRYLYMMIFICISLDFTLACIFMIISHPILRECMIPTEEESHDETIKLEPQTKACVYQDNCAFMSQ